MEPKVDVISRDLSRMIREQVVDAQRHAMSAHQVEDRRSEPVTIPKLEGEWVLAREGLQEGFEPIDIRAPAGWELSEDDADAVIERAECLEEPLEPRNRVAKSLHVGAVSAQLDRESEGIRYRVPPGADRLASREAVEGRVQLD
jgi:hypothetical protein